MAGGKAALDATQRVAESSERLDFLRDLVERVGSFAGIRIGASRFVDPRHVAVELPERASWTEYVALGAVIGLNDAETVAEVEYGQAAVREAAEADQWRALVVEEETRVREMQASGYHVGRSIQLPPEFRHIRAEVQSQLSAAYVWPREST